MGEGGIHFEEIPGHCQSVTDFDNNANLQSPLILKSCRRCLFVSVECIAVLDTLSIKMSKYKANNNNAKILSCFAV